MTNVIFEANNWIVVATTLVVVVMCVGLHYEVLSTLNRWLPNIGHRHRRRIFILILLILVAHVAEIWLFTFGYYFLIEMQSLGSLIGMTTNGLSEYAYFSSMVYTTVGFGDQIPEGPIRLLAGIEALAGLVMITWSASFTFLEMQRYWRPF